MIIGAVVGVCYWKRRQISEWFLWRVGRFRFRNLHTQRNMAVDVEIDEEEENARL